MNQILDYGTGGNNDNNEKDKKFAKKNNSFREENNYENNNFSGNEKKSSVSDKIVKVFAFLMIILAIALIVSGVTSLLKNKKDVTAKEKTPTTTQEVVEANISAEMEEETGNVTIIVENEIAISKVIYSWDTGHDEQVEAGEQKKTLEINTSVPYGEHVLHVKVIDEEKNETTKEFTFTSETGKDTTKPEITLSLTEDNKLLVTATDDTSIAYVTYTWNEDDTVTMTPDEEGLQEYEFELDIPMGKNTIVVFAVDGSETANAKTATKVLNGVTKPVINASLDATGAYVEVVCSHEKGIKSIYYTLNGTAYQWEVPEGETAPFDLKFTQQSAIGPNEMRITVTSVDDITAEFNPVWEYGGPTTPEDSTQTPTNTAENTNQ